MWPFKGQKKEKGIPEMETAFGTGAIGIKDIIAPASIEDYLQFFEIRRKDGQNFFCFFSPPLFINRLVFSGN